MAESFLRKQQGRQRDMAQKSYRLLFFIEKTIIVFDQVLAKQGACLDETQILACISDFARKKSYISAHSSKESQAAYKALGCVHAEEIIPWIADEEPFDVQLEYVL